jgi:hypothetical protein
MQTLLTIVGSPSDGQIERWEIKSLKPPIHLLIKMRIHSSSRDEPSPHGRTASPPLTADVRLDADAPEGWEGDSPAR